MICHRPHSRIQGPCKWLAHFLPIQLFRCDRSSESMLGSSLDLVIQFRESQVALRGSQLQIFAVSSGSHVPSKRRLLVWGSVSSRATLEMNI
jgi:hypothetical protein